MIANTIEQFRAEMASKGITYSGEIKPDTNKIERFDVDGDKRGSLKGYYTLHTDGIPAGIFGSWDKNGADYIPWCAKSRNDMSPNERQAHEEKIKTLRQLRDKEENKRHNEAKFHAQNRFNKATEAVTHLYLTKKDICAYNLRCDFQESEQYPTLLVPLHNIEGEIQSLQRIIWNEKEQTFSKMFLASGATKGNFLLIGLINKSTDVILVCEGYATGATLYEALEYPTICTFSCWNLKHVALNVRRKYPNAKIIICGDDDIWPDKVGHSKENSGRHEAEKAAKAINAAIVFPSFSTDENQLKSLECKRPTDFNDIVSILKYGGTRETALKEVKRQINKCVISLKNTTKLPPNFSLMESGLFFSKIDSEGNSEQIFICSKIQISAYLRDNDSTNWGRLLEFYDADNVRHTWGMPMSMLKGNGEELRGELLNRGLLFGYGQTAKNKFMEYITCSIPTVFARCVSQIGWHGEDNNRVFVLPDQTIGQATDRIVYQTENPGSHFKTSGTLDEWKDNVAKFCVDNSRLALAVSTAFAPMLLAIIGGDSGGINIFGASSIGKTTVLRISTSVYSDPSYLSRWRATVNGLEALAASRNDCLLTLDELAQIDPKEAGNAIYTLANGAGKARANQYGGSRTKNEWRILFLSSGEIDLNQHISDGGKKVTAGQQVRCIDIYADTEKGIGIFENLHGFHSGAEFSNYLKEMTARFYGTPAIAFLNKLIEPENFTVLLEEWNQKRQEFIAANIDNDADGQVKRVAERLALIAFAGELATKYGLTGWPTGEARKAAEICLNLWIKHRGGTKNSEEATLLLQIKSILEAHGDSRFQLFENSRELPIIRDRLGFKEQALNPQGEVFYRYYILSSVFSELHKGYTKAFAKEVLINAGWLEINKDGEASQSKYIPSLGKKVRCYVLTDIMWEI